MRRSKQTARRVWPWLLLVLSAPAFASTTPLSGGPLVWLLFGLVVASYLSEDLTCIGAGLLVAEGMIGFPAAVGACLVGLLSGDIALFAAGRWLGEPALKRLVRPARLKTAADWLRLRGPWVIIVSRFTPGTRLPTYVAAGALHMPWLRFIGWFALATALWTPLLVALAMLLGEQFRQWFEQYAAFGVWLLAALGVALWLVLRVMLPLATHRGRRLAVSRWRRLTRFEFWPRSAFYPPIVLYCLWLALRYRSATLFTLANPAIPLGGLIGESKADILEGLAGSGNVASFARIDAASTEARLTQLRDSALDYPLVLKPDSGERGHAVAIIHDEATATAYIDAHEEPLIAQRYVAGQEFGVFYIRLPGEPKGFIYSLTRKGRTIVTGDGERTLERLILDDPRAVCMAAYFLREHGAGLARVPAAGESITLNRIGTHSRGSLFTDAGALITPALTAEIERISRHFEGFYLGRYDLMAADDDALQNGEGLTVIELNGVSSEATHIYHPGYSVWFGWRTIARQWRYAWQIGDRLRRQGHTPPGALRVLRAVFARGS